MAAFERLCNAMDTATGHFKLAKYYFLARLGIDECSVVLFRYVSQTQNQ